MKFAGQNIMQLALEQAQQAAVKGEVPIGAVMVSASGEVISVTHNLVEENGNATHHAEILAISEASEKLGSKFLNDCTLYVTLEPCAMCATAIAHSRVGKLVYAAKDPKGGAVEHGARIFSQSTTHHRPEIVSGIMEKECSEIISKFFKELR